MTLPIARYLNVPPERVYANRMNWQARARGSGEAPSPAPPRLPPAVCHSPLGLQRHHLPHRLPPSCPPARLPQWDDETGEPTRLVGFDESEPTARNQVGRGDAWRIRGAIC